MDRHGVLVAAACLAALLVTAGACRTSRFPTCDNDEQCAEQDDGARKRYCVDLRCVECRADSDCEAGEVCNRRTYQCDKL